MQQVPGKKHLATILALDMAGYSARAEQDEAGALAAVAALHRRVSDVAAAHDGRVFNTAGDGLMLEFDAAESALAAAYTLLAHAPMDPPRIRIGIHAGDVTASDSGDLLGHGVNVAARLEQMARVGTALVSRAAADLVRGEFRQRLVPVGRMTLDKMDETIEAFTLDPTARVGAARKPRRRRTWVAIALAGVAASVAVVALLWSAGVVGPSREATVRTALRDPESVRAITREVVNQLVSARADPQSGDAAFAAITSLGASDAGADRAAFSFLRRGETDNAVTTLEHFGEDLVSQGANAEASGAFSRAARIAAFSDPQRALRNAQRAFTLAPASRSALEDVVMDMNAVDGADATITSLQRVIARERNATAFRAFAHGLVAVLATGHFREALGAREIAAATSDAAAFPNDVFLQAYLLWVRASAEFTRGGVRAAGELNSAALVRFARIPGEELRARPLAIQILERAGDWEGALNASRALISERERLGAPPSLTALQGACNNALSLGRVAEAAPFCRAYSQTQTGPVVVAFALADLSAAEGRIDESRHYVQQARTNPHFENNPDDRNAIAYDEMIWPAYQHNFEEAEQSLAAARAVVRAAANGVEDEENQLSYFTRWLGLREVWANRLEQGCPMLAEAARHYRAFGADPGAAASEQAMREAHCPAR